MDAIKTKTHKSSDDGAVEDDKLFLDDNVVESDKVNFGEVAFTLATVIVETEKVYCEAVETADVPLETTVVLLGEVVVIETEVELSFTCGVMDVSLNFVDNDVVLVTDDEIVVKSESVTEIVRLTDDD